VALLEGVTEETCGRCEDDLRDKPLVGMCIPLDLDKDCDEWIDSKILNPADDITHISKAKLNSGSGTLDVTGK
jgi:hypothetical protein